MNTVTKTKENPIGYKTEEELISDVSQATPHRLVQMLYQGALKRIIIAKDAIDNNDYETRDKTIDRIISIIKSLDESLNYKDGGEIAKGLHLVYHQSILLLLEAQQYNTSSLLEEPFEILAQMNDSWNNINK
ncbi:MAG: flagellar export chaperone FliS [Thiotrichales bacterium]|jgi:flagellar protein FliS|nr:flagellar export chaperone FliS [Thiotrichales bacterium]MBT3613009.1 flagellar export chaperone FliS [Thiotrichales bacterium]MBT3752055.1 flagellar export chaperone FliS [Thiotrichales bacterium]MBT3838153.1 flagellar export chaperone FliS [Thiotrichales bacterium]MBT4152463.1 flagellar export chaperone FliS [Thiotrichales bacterium]